VIKLQITKGSFYERIVIDIVITEVVTGSGWLSACSRSISTSFGHVGLVWFVWLRRFLDWKYGWGKL
jgi:hypothetical protein